MKKNILFYITFFLCSLDCLATPSFKVVVGLSKPPYVFQENQTGFELELIQQLLKSIEKRPEFIFIPYGRSEKMLALPDIDAVMTATPKVFKNFANLSEIYINYQNVAISLKSNNIALNNITDISKYSVATFQSAHKILGADFGSAVTKSPIYIQVANQERQLELLLLGRVEILIMDIKIFSYYLAQQNFKINNDDIKIHEIFPLSPYRVAFKNNADVAPFNQALKAFKLSSKYQDLLEKYNF